MALYSLFWGLPREGHLQCNAASRPKNVHLPLRRTAFHGARKRSPVIQTVPGRDFATSLNHLRSSETWVVASKVRNGLGEDFFMTTNLVCCSQEAMYIILFACITAKKKRQDHVSRIPAAGVVFLKNFGRF